ncbi:phage tail tape measure protein [Streptomyces sp. NPDC003720]|uniref:phage tail tape measure protein n=1 Tax=Streptomyces sp. NPDC003720 TaxID=3364684 RepID=UPI0036915426
MPSVGYATIQIIPSIRGVADELRRQLTGPAGDAGGQAGQAAGDSLLDKLKVGAAAAGVAAGAILVKGLGDAIDQANVTSKLQAQLGTSNKVAAQQGKLAGKLYSTGVTDSFESAADAIKSVMQSGLAPPGATTKQLEKLATKASDVATVFDQDLGGVTNAVSQMLRTGLAKNADQAFDLITKGFQGGTDKAGDFLDTINEYGTQFRKAGLDGAAGIGLLNQAIQGGARDADLAADAIKEFSIRAIDGSDSTATGFKALGLNADQMAARFAKGGSTANGVLDLTLDKLRGIKDPVKQAQAATALFGTQAEDLGKALFAMDPSKAAKGLGQVGGAAEKVGKNIRSGPQYELQVFTRTLQQGLVNFLGGEVLPLLAEWGGTFNRDVLPPLKTVGSALASLFLPALSLVGSVLSGMIDWFKQWGVWLVPLAIAIGGVTLALNAQAIATGIVTAVFSVYRAAILIGTAVTNGFAAAQAVLNAVMSLNPFVLVAIALVALGAALVIAWKKSETFRAIVMAAWEGIKTAALYVWNSVLKPAFEGIKAALSALGTAFAWLWNVVIKPVFGFISTAARVLLTIFTIVVFGPIYLAVKALGAVFSWLWTNAISPVIGWIVAGFKLWWGSIKVVFGYFSAGIRMLATWAMWLWHNAISPAVRGIVAAAKFMWTGVKIIFGYFTGGIKTLASWAKWLWTNGVKPAFNGIKSVISTVYSVGIKPVFDKLRAALGQVGKAFSTAKDAIKTAWDKVKGIAKAPVVFVVNTVYGKLRGVWNTVAGAFGAPKLPEYKFASGGVLPGYTPGRDVHLAALSGGEAIMRPEWTRAVGSGYVNSMNAAARTGGVTGVQRALGLPAFADGGIFGWVKSAASKGYDLGKSGVSWLKDGVKASALSGLNSVVKPLINKISGSASLYRDMITRVPKKMISTIVDFSDKADKKLEDAGIGGKGYKSALSWARTQNGKPYQWGGNGDPSWDCCIIGPVRIYGPNGATPIQDVRAGDQVYSYVDGKLTTQTVTAAWKSKTQQVYKVRTRNRSVTASANHPFMRLVMVEPSRHVKGGKRGEQIPARYDVEWVRLDELKRGDLLVQPREMDVQHVTAPELPDGTPVSEDIAWLLGLFVGDGYVTNNTVRICVYDDNSVRAQQIFRSLGINSFTSPKHGVVASSVAFVQTLRDMGLDVPGLSKRVPKAAWTWNRELRQAFLDGYCAADGHRPTDQARHGERTYASASRELVEDVRALHLMLGQHPSNISTNNRTKPIVIKGVPVKDAKPLHTFSVWRGRRDGEVALRRLSAGIAAWLDAGDFTVAKVLEVTDEGVQDTYDLEVAEAHNFVADGIVVHNSGFMSAIESVIRGQKPHRRWATGAFSGSSAPSGWVRGARSPFMIGITNAGVGHTAGTLNGVNVESRGGDGVIVGSRARGYNASLFTDRYGFKGYANGGSPRPGEIAWVGENGPELIRFSGGEVVYSHADSMRMAAGLGGLRGFAKGTRLSGTYRTAAQGKAYKQVPGDLSGFTKALHGSAADISKAAKELAKDLKAAGGAGRTLSKSTLKTSAKLESLAKRRDAVASKLATARQAATDQKQAASDFLSVSNLGDATSVNNLITSMRQRQTTAKTFQSSIKTLSKKGLSQTLIRQLVAMGPDSQLAGMVATAGSSQIHQLNALAKSGVKLSSTYGNTMADAMYDSGKNASKGFLTGLVSQEKELQAAMDKLASSLVKSIKKKLKIKSPSRVTHALGAYTGQGFAIGLDSTASQVAAAATRVSRAAVPAVPGAGRAGALGAGQFTVEVHTKDEALSEFVEVRIRDNNGRILTGLNARPRG